MMVSTVMVTACADDKGALEARRGPDTVQHSGHDDGSNVEEDKEGDSV